MIYTKFHEYKTMVEEPKFYLKDRESMSEGLIGSKITVVTTFLYQHRSRDNNAHNNEIFQALPYGFMAPLFFSQ
jgi:hypothetical protein